MKSIYAFFKKFLDIIKIIEDTICIIGTWICSILIFVAVINRYFLHFEIMWFNDLALYFFIFYIMFSIVITTRDDSHTALDVFKIKLFRKNYKAGIVYSIFLRTISFIVVFIFGTVAYKFMLRAIKYPEFGTLVRWFNESWLHSLLFFIIILILIYIFELILKDINQLQKIDTKTGGK